MGKSKNESSEKLAEKEEAMDVTMEESAALSYNDKLRFCNPIAQPMAGKKLAKKIYKLLKKSSSHKKYVSCGLKLVQKQIRLGNKGIVVFAGDIFPIEIMCHLPSVCEEKSLSYCYVPSRQDIGTALGLKRGTLIVLIKEHEEFKDLYDEVKAEIKLLPMPL